MQKIIASFIIVFSVLLVNAQQTTAPDKVIYGQCSIDDLKQAPFNTWFNSGFELYAPDPVFVGQLKKLGYKGITIDIFFGSWCGDSKREVPRLLKVMSAISFPEHQLKLIGLGGTDSLYKRSPNGEDGGKGVYRVPTFIIYRNGKEIGRINEFPVYTFERDLYTILSGHTYTPNYSSFSFIHQWEKEGVLTHAYTNVRSLAAIVKSHVENEYLLNSVGNLFLKQEKVSEAICIYKINYALYPESGLTVAGVGKGLLKNKNTKTAIEYLEYALQINKKPENVKDILEVLYEAKDMERMK